MHRSSVAAEDGVVLAGALLALLIVTGLAAIVAAMAMVETQATGAGRTREVGVSAAEAAAEIVVARVGEGLVSWASPCTRADGVEEYQTSWAGAPATHQVPWSGGWEAAVPKGAQRQWVLDRFAEAKAAPAQSGLIAVPGGLAYGIRPIGAGNACEGVVFGVSEVHGAVRVVRRDLHPFEPNWMQL